MGIMEAAGQIWLRRMKLPLVHVFPLHSEQNVKLMVFIVYLTL